MAVGGALFGNGRGGAPASKALVEFRAGKMTVSGSLISPDKRKGMIQVKKYVLITTTFTILLRRTICRLYLIVCILVRLNKGTTI